jgi:hypothetical protein
MSIESIRFHVCDSCGERFRSDRRGVEVGAQMLCSRCRAARGLDAGVRDEGEDAAAGRPGATEEDWRALDGSGGATVPELPAAVMPPALTVVELAAGRELPPLGPMPAVSVRLLHRRIRTRHERRGKRRRKTWHRVEASAPTPRNRRRRRRWIWRWPRMVALVGVVAVVVWIGQWQLQKLGRELARPLVFEAPVELGGPIRTLPDLVEAQRLAQRFVVAGSVDEAWSLVRPWDGVREALAQFLEGWQPPADPAVQIIPLPPELEGGLAYQVFGLITAEGQGRLLPVVPTAGGPRLDFKAFIEWSSAAPAALLDGSVEAAAEVRVMLRPATYYNFGFADAGRFQAFEATVRGRDEPWLLYALRDSDETRRLDAAAARLGMHPATVALRSVDGSHRHRQFLITRLLAVGFVVPDEPDPGASRADNNH